MRCGDISNAYAGQKVKVADVATAFDTYVPFNQTTTYKGQKVPVAVARICQYTWMCQPGPRGPNVHANDAGYQKIEGVFKKLV